jgi:hypothetical protein
MGSSKAETSVTVGIPGVEIPQIPWLWIALAGAGLAVIAVIGVVVASEMRKPIIVVAK